MAVKQQQISDSFH